MARPGVLHHHLWIHSSEQVQDQSSNLTHSQPTKFYKRSDTELRRPQLYDSEKTILSFIIFNTSTSNTNMMAATLKASLAVFLLTVFCSSSPVPSSQQDVVTFTQSNWDTYLRNLENLAENVSHTANESQINFGNINECPVKIAEGSELPTRLRSSCPWYYTYNRTNNRYPVSILEAKSPCEFCVESNETRQCEPVTRQVKVLYQTEFNPKTNSFNFREGEHEMVVGFTCSGRRTATSTNSDSDSGVIFDKK